MTTRLMSARLLKDIAVKNSLELQTEKYIQTFKNALPKTRIGNTIINEIFLDGLAEQDKVIKQLIINGETVYTTYKLINGCSKTRKQTIRRIQESLKILISFGEALGFKFNIGEIKNTKSPGNDFYEFFETRIIIA